MGGACNSRESRSTCASDASKEKEETFLTFASGAFECPPHYDTVYRASESAGQCTVVSPTSQCASPTSQCANLASQCKAATSPADPSSQRHAACKVCRKRYACVAGQRHDANGLVELPYMREPAALCPTCCGKSEREISEQLIGPAQHVTCMCCTKWGNRAMRWKWVSTASYLIADADGLCVLCALTQMHIIKC